jgi:hypothetical protein
MKVTASGGTDGANIVLFWPDNLPENADATLKDDPIALVEKLRDEGKLIWFPCDGDGCYTVGIFVRSEVPGELLAICRDETRYPTLVVSGAGYFGGLEYIFKRDSSLLHKYPHMCEPVTIPEGNYSARVFRTDIPQRLYGEWLVKQAGAWAKRLWDTYRIIVGCCVAGVFASLITFFFASRNVWLAIVALTAALIVSAVAMSRTKWYRVVANARDSFGKAYPSYVVHLE